MTFGHNVGENGVLPCLPLSAGGTGNTYSIVTHTGIPCMQKTESSLSSVFFTVCTSWLEKNNTCLFEEVANNSFQVSAILFCSLFSYIGCVMKNRRQGKEKTMVIQAVLVTPG